MNNNDNNENKIIYLRLDDIIPNRFQPREVFDETGLEELADSIKEHGVIQPIIVRQIGNKYELIAGERRSKASAMAGLTTIPAIIRNMDDRESAKVSLLENLQRKNLSAIEEARTYKKILELDNMTQEDLAKTMGKSQPLIANKLRLLSLPEEVQDALIKNQISERHARSLLNVKNKQNQLMLLDRIRNERLTVRELDAEIKKLNETTLPANDTSDDTVAGGNSYNNFSENSNMSTSVSYQNNFNNMGLNDYQSSINNNMFNNIPSNYQSFSNDSATNQFNNIPDNNNALNRSFDYEINNTPVNSFFDQENSVTTSQQTNNYSSLGSMFDGQVNNNLENENNFMPEESDNKNLFVSQIKENESTKQGNQFLPNFEDPIQGDFSNSQDDYNTNSFDNFGVNNMNSFNQSNDFNGFENNNGMSYDNNEFNYQQNNLDTINNVGYNQPIADFGAPINDYQDNQGGLFNQPLNIVDVPNNETYIKASNESNRENNNFEQIQDNTKDNGTFDNPFDDSYENILFTKPVPIQQPQESEITSSPTDFNLSETKDSSNSVQEVSNEEVLEKKNEYISLDPVRTIYDTRGAVLELKKTTDQIKQNKIKIDTEEIDYDDYYEIVIRIKK